MAETESQDYKDFLETLTEVQRGIIESQTKSRVEAINAKRDLELKDYKREKEAELQKFKEKLQKESEDTVSLVKERLKYVLHVAKRPPIFDSETMDIELYMNIWEKHCQIRQLSDHLAIISFQTYLPLDCQEKIKVLNISEQGTWAQFKERVIHALKPSIPKLVYIKELQNIKQEANESIYDFTSRMLILASKAYGSDEKSAMDETLKECLMRGLYNKDIAVFLIEEWTSSPTLTVTDAIKLAISKELAVRAREALVGPVSNNASLAMLTMTEENNTWRDPRQH